MQIRVGRNKSHATTDTTGEKKKYESLQNKFSKGIAFGVGIILLGTTILLYFAGLSAMAGTLELEEKYGIIGVTILLFCVLMNLNLWIESGFNLPFVSYGIGNLIMNVISLSIILSVYRRKDINLCEEGYEEKYESTLRKKDFYE